MDINDKPITAEERAIYETENNKRFVSKVVNIDSSMIKTFDYIKENFNVDAKYDDDENGDITLSPVDGQVCESENLLDAKEYLLKHIDNDYINDIMYK